VVMRGRKGVGRYLLVALGVYIDDVSVTVE